MESLRTAFRPEFLNRIDDIVVFNALTMEQVGTIAAIMLTNLSERLQKQLNITLMWDDDVLKLLAKEGYDPAFGARPLRRQISQLVETELSKMIVRGQTAEGDTVKLKAHDDTMLLETVPKELKKP